MEKRLTGCIAALCCGVLTGCVSVSGGEEEAVAARDGRVIAFNRDECPRGWTEFEPAYGRFVRGIDKSGAGRDPAGQRAPGHIQSDSVGSHGHKYQGGGAAGVTRADAGDDRGGLWHDGDWKQNGNRNTHGNPSGETRPANVALLYCTRD